jgi:hypothetical protein
MKSYTLTYPDRQQQPENQIYSEVGSGTEFEILEENRENGTLQIDVAVPDQVTPDYFSEAETVAEAGYTLNQEVTE